jgi:hypothetical protein
MTWFVAAGAGALSALILAAAAMEPAAGTFLVVAPLPLFLAGLGQGVTGALVAGAAAAVVFGLVAGPLGGLMLAATFAGPVLWLVRQALLSRPAADGSLEWYPPGLLVTWLTAIGVGWLALMMLWLGAGEAGLRDALAAHVEGPLRGLLPGLTDEEAGAAARNMAGIVLGMSAMGGQIWLLGNGALAQSLLARFSRNLRPSPRYAALRLPVWLAPALTADLALAVAAPGTVGLAAQNLAFVLALPYFLLGLAVIHTLARRLTARGMVLALVYAMLLFMAWAVLVVAALGLYEQWGHLRRRFGPAGQGQEDE